MSAISVVNLTKRPTPSWPFESYKKKILGAKYDLSLVFCTPAKARSLSLDYHHKDKPANVLSFPLSKTAGEIFIKLPAKDFPIEHLFIHALLHLKGWRHGSKMEQEEKRYLNLLENNGKSQINRRTGHRNNLDKVSRLRTTHQR